MVPDASWVRGPGAAAHDTWESPGRHRAGEPHGGNLKLGAGRLSQGHTTAPEQGRNDDASNGHGTIPKVNSLVVGRRSRQALPHLPLDLFLRCLLLRRQPRHLHAQWLRATIRKSIRWVRFLFLLYQNLEDVPGVKALHPSLIILKSGFI